MHVHYIDSKGQAQSVRCQRWSEVETVKAQHKTWTVTGWLGEVIDRSLNQQIGA